MKQSPRSPRSLRRSRVTTVLVVAAMAATACVQQDPPGLAITKLEANLVFGAKPADAAPTPAQSAAAQPAPPTFPDLNLSVGRDRGTFTTSPPPPPECPKSDDIAVEFSASANIPVTDPPTRPREGVYRWLVRAGRQRSDASLELQPVGFEERVIRNVQEVPPSQWSVNPVASFDREVFTYEEVRRLAVDRGQAPSEDSDRFLVTTYQVDTDAVTGSSSATSGVYQPPKAGDPERGIVLKRSEVVDATGAPVPGVRPFNPRNGLLLLPLAVSSAEQYRSVAIDSASGATVVHEAEVGSREIIDACGKLMDGWQVVSLQESTQDSGGETRATTYDYTYLVATQHGGVIIYEEIVNKLALLAVEYTLAQFEPDAMPESGLPR